MKKILFISVFSMLLFSCSSSDDNGNNNDELTCAEAEQNVITAFNNAMNLGTVEACQAYRTAVLAQAEPCNYTTACLTLALDNRGVDCTVGSGGTTNVGSGAVVDDGSGISECN